MFKGLSTSMPEDVQQKILNSMPGLENVQMMRAGYAIEYDAVEPSQLMANIRNEKRLKIFIQLDKSMEHQVMKKQQVKESWQVSMRL